MIMLHTLSNAELRNVAERDLTLIAEPARTLVAELASRLRGREIEPPAFREQRAYRDEELR